MVTETNFDLNNLVYYMEENTVKKARITRIEISRGITNVQNYTKYISYGKFTKSPTEIFKTKQELLNSL